MEYTLISTKENKTIGKAILSDTFDSLQINFEGHYKKDYEGVVLSCLKSVNQKGNFGFQVDTTDEGIKVIKLSKDIWFAIKQNILLNTPLMVHVDDTK